MPPTSDGSYTVGCSFDKLVPDEAHKASIRDAVHRVHKCTILATELLNIFVRDRLTNNEGTEINSVFDHNWIRKAYLEVTHGKRGYVHSKSLRETRERLMEPFEQVDRTGISQVIGYECINLATVAKNNVFMHFKKRLLSHVRVSYALTDESYKALTREEKRARALQLMHVAEDLAREPTNDRKSPEEFHE